MFVNLTNIYITKISLPGYPLMEISRPVSVSVARDSMSDYISMDRSLADLARNRHLHWDTDLTRDGVTDFPGNLTS